LHAAHLAFVHPVSGDALAFDAEVPADFAELLALLNGDLARHPEEGPVDVWR
jgi:23S rRNA pseudouridine1911/1915/1917 synthase